MYLRVTKRSDALNGVVAFVAVVENRVRIFQRNF